MFEIQNRPFRSAKYWHELADSIDMYPEYQRQGGIWSEPDQGFLVDSILNGYDIPKLYLVDFTILPSSLNKEKKRFAVVDGKQRLEAIFRFFEGDLKLQKGAKWIEGGNRDVSGLGFEELRSKYPELASRITEYPLPVMHIVTDEEDRIKDLFVRLNRGANLTGAEKRNAMIGPLPREIRHLSDHPFFKTHIRYQTKRGQNLNAAAKLLRFELSGKPVDTKKNQLDDMVLGYSKFGQAEIDNAVANVSATLDRMTKIFGIQDRLLGSQGPIPVYYWFVKSLRRADPRAREFLQKFERHFRSTRKEGAQRDAFLVAYDNAMRSTNDGWSHDVRVRILQARFEQWLATGHL